MKKKTAMEISDELAMNSPKYDYVTILEMRVKAYKKTLMECIRQDGLIDFLDNNDWASSEDYFVHIAKEVLK
jgi:hypothetical protein